MCDDGYRLQMDVRDGRTRLYTINGADWSKRDPLIVRAPASVHAPNPSISCAMGLVNNERMLGHIEGSG
jgi:ATP-dependent DNA ligase